LRRTDRMLRRLKGLWCERSVELMIFTQGKRQGFIYLFLERGPVIVVSHGGGGFIAANSVLRPLSTCQNYAAGWRGDLNRSLL